MIELFVEIYKKKDLCEYLLKKFKEMNLHQKDNEKNMDRESFLEKNKSIFNSIISEAGSYNYNTVEFYGVILCYLSFYDKDNFSKIINELCKNNLEVLFEILLIYNSHLKYYPINQNYEFLNKFIEYTILNKDYTFFKRGLEYIRDIETFINIMEKNKENFFNKYIKNNKDYLKYIIKLDDNLKNIRAENLPPQSEPIPPKNASLIIKLGDDKENNSNEQKKYSKNKNENQFIIKMIKNIDSLILFSRENKIFLIYFTTSFWKYLLNNFNEPNQHNIYICYKLREIFIKYKDLVNEIFKNKDKKFTIKKDANNYYELDEFAFLLDQIINKYIQNNKELQNIEKLAFITQYNPYYKEKKYTNNIDINIFDIFDVNNIDNEFIEDFRNMEFEIIFQKNINEYINKILSKIQNISDFDNAIKLINIKKINDKNIYLNSLTKIYDLIIIKNEINQKLENYQILARLAILFFNYENGFNKFKFIENKIKRLDKDIIHKIFIEIMRIYNNQKDKEKEENEYEEIIEIENGNVEDFDKMKDYIFEEFINLKEEKDIENIISLIECLEGKDNEIKDKKKEENKEILNEFLNKLGKKNIFLKEEFFSSKKSLKILLLSKLKEKGVLHKDNNGFFDNLKENMISIKKTLEGEITKKTLDEFLNIEESIIRQRLNLLSLININYNSNDEFLKLKYNNDKINEDLVQLKEIKDNIIIYHRETYKDKIKALIEFIKDGQNKKIKDYKIGKIKILIKGFEGLRQTIDKVKDVKNNLLFNAIYKVKDVKNNLLFNAIYKNINLSKSEGESFNNAVEKLDIIGEKLKKNIDIVEIYNNKEYKNIFNIIIEKLNINEQRVQKFIDEDLKKFFGITNKDLINDLNILFKIKKYEMDIKSIIFFFEFFQKDNSIWNQKLDKKKFENIFRKKENEQENDFKIIKQYLTELKDNKIYDYDNIQNYNKLFAYLYDKKEAIDFLFSKLDQNITYLYDIIQPNDSTISITNIRNTEYCISAFRKMKTIEDNFKIFAYIKSMNENEISKFENYSRIYSSVIELDISYDDSENLYHEIMDKIKDKTFNIYQDEDDFNLEDLIQLKNKIYIKNENIDEKKIEANNYKEKQLKLKCKIMIFF